MEGKPPIIFHIANLMFLAITTLNIYWFVKILKGCHRVYTKGLSEAKSGSRDAEVSIKQSKVKDGPKQDWSYIDKL